MARHPGEILAEDFLRPLGLSANQLARGLGLNRSTIGRLIAGEHRISVRMAVRLGQYFGVPPRWWLLMQADYDAGEAEARADLCEGVTPLDLDPDVLLTPRGVMRLEGAADAGPEQAISIKRRDLEQPASGGQQAPREVRVVRYENGSIALVGDES
ncbi:MAG: HigA family addiction module antidote protein [Deltaproteobacteria bacterium]|nr:HigA family addiction module antidote protein [Deltaproteobacteria bacterium]